MGQKPYKKSIEIFIHTLDRNHIKAQQNPYLIIQRRSIDYSIIPFLCGHILLGVWRELMLPPPLESIMSERAGDRIGGGV